MKNRLNILILVAFVSVISIKSYSQHLGCGFDVIQAQLPKMHRLPTLEGDVRPLNFSSVQYLPIQVIVFAKNNGTYSSSKETIYRSLARMNYFFGKAGVQFYIIDSLRVINNDTLNDWETTKDEGTALSLYGRRDVINLFCVDRVTIGGQLYGGYYTFNGTTQSVIAGNSQILNGNMMEHEFGHLLGMIHTFQNSNSATISERELVVRPPDARANCSTTGDYVCDTPADPYVFQGPSVASGCLYTGTTTDALGMGYSPDLSNIMSYFFCKSNNFSAGQISRMNSFFNSSYTGYYSFLTASGFNVNAPSNLTLVSSDGIYFNTFNWKDNATNEQGYLLELSTNTTFGFYSASYVLPNVTNVKLGGLQRNTTYYARVKPLNSKSSFSNVITFQTGSSFYETPKFYRAYDSTNYAYQFVSVTGANYSSFSSTNLKGFPEEVYNLNKTVTVSKSTGFGIFAGRNNCFNYATHIVWVDLNQNGNFNDPGETVMTQPISFSCLSGLVTLPSSLANGTYKVRLASVPDEVYSNESSGLIVYEKYNFYDFTINVIPTDTITLVLNPLTITSFGPIISWKGNLSKTKNINILRSISSTGGFVSIGTAAATVTSYMDNTNISSNTTYFYKITSLEYPSVQSSIRSIKSLTKTICSPVGYTPPGCNGYSKLQYNTFSGAYYQYLNIVDTACNAERFSDRLKDTLYVVKNKKYPYSLKSTANCGGFLINAMVFADFNGDGTYNGATETLKIFSTSGVCFNDTLSIPNTIPNGNYTIRVIAQNFLANNGACGTYSSFTTMKFFDFTIKVIPADTITLLLNPITITSFGPKLSWKGNLSKTKNITILRSISSTGGFVSVGTAIATVSSYIDNANISPNTTYYYKIASYEFPSVESSIRSIKSLAKTICIPTGYTPPTCDGTFKLQYNTFSGAYYQSLNIVDTACSTERFSDRLKDTLYVAKNKKYPYALKSTANCGGYLINAMVFADFNGDGLYNGANETLKIFSTSGVCFNDTLFIPNTIPTGIYTIRVLSQSFLVNNGACGAYSPISVIKFFDFSLKVISTDSSLCRPSGYSAPNCNYNQLKKIYFQGANYTSISKNDTVCSSNLFSNYQKDTLFVTRNKKYSYSFKLNDNCGGAAVYAGLYADFNKDKSFDGPNETLKLYTFPGVCFTDSLSIPSNIPKGTYPLRLFSLTNKITNGVCGAYPYTQGKFYDFTLRVISQDSATYYCDISDPYSNCSSVKMYDFILSGSSGTGISKINMACSTQPNYVDFRQSGLLLYTNKSYSFTIRAQTGCTQTSPGSFFGINVGLWIDYNNNKSFTDAGENILLTNFNSSNYSCLIRGNFTVPGVASNKPIKLRLRSRYYVDGQVDPCTKYSFFSDSQDYTVLVADSGKTNIITQEDASTSETNTFELYPNPTHTNFIIKITGGMQSNEFTHYQIYDIRGAKIIEKELNSNNRSGNEIEIEAQGIPNGTYFIQLLSTDAVVKKIFIKEESAR